VSRSRLTGGQRDDDLRFQIDGPVGDLARSCEVVLTEQRGGVLAEDQLVIWVPVIVEGDPEADAAGVVAGRSEEPDARDQRGGAIQSRALPNPSRYVLRRSNATMKVCEARSSARSRPARRARYRWTATKCRSKTAVKASGEDNDVAIAAPSRLGRAPALPSSSRSTNS
jgi:hypothetical protein